jgi:hypothetical protein
MHLERADPFVELTSLKISGEDVNRPPASRESFADFLEADVPWIVSIPHQEDAA